MILICIPYIRRLLLILMGNAVAAGTACAQPSLKTFWSLEAKIAQADAVVRGRIAKISLNEIVPPGGRDQNGILQPNGVYDRTLTVKVDEVLKGNIKGNLDDLRPIEVLSDAKCYDEWMMEHTTFLWFLGPKPKETARRGWEILRLGSPVKAETQYAPCSAPPLFSMDLSVLKDAKETLDRAQTYANISSKPLLIHVIRIPPILAMQVGSGGPWNDLIVPVEPSLEGRAKLLIASPLDFLPKGNRLDALARYQLRFGGVNSLRYFKSDRNIAMLRTLLDEPLEDFKSGLIGQYPIRTKVYEILLGWNADVPVPKSAAEWTSLDLAGTHVTDAAMKQLAGLKNLETLDLQDTRVTDEGLRALAGLKKLTLLRLSDTQVTDANLRALREIDLLHALSHASGKGDRRPSSADDVLTLALYRTMVTDAGLKELAGLKNMTALYLNHSQVSGTGAKELIGLKNLTTLHLRNAPVTDAGAKELASLTQLTNLALNHAKITTEGLKELARLENLTDLDLCGTDIRGAPLKELTNLKKLVRLHLSDFQMSDASLHTLHEIGMLHAVDHANANRANRLKSDEDMKSFSLSGPLVTNAALKELTGLKNLQHLHLGGHKLTGAGLKDLGGLKKLTYLHVHGAPLTAAGLRELANLKSLKTLHLHGKDVTDERLRVLREIGMLHVLYGASARADYPPATQPPRAKSDPEVISLDLGGWHSTEGAVVTDASLKDIATLKNLVKLNLTHTPVTGSGLMELAALKHLTNLSLGGPQVTDFGLKDLASLENLVSLGLHDTKVTKAGVKELAGLRKLSTLNLSGKAVTDDWLKELAGLKSLTHLRILWTSVSDAGVADFHLARPNCTVDR